MNQSGRGIEARSVLNPIGTEMVRLTPGRSATYTRSCATTQFRRPTFVAVNCDLKPGWWPGDSFMGLTVLLNLRLRNPIRLALTAHPVRYEVFVHDGCRVVITSSNHASTLNDGV